MVGVGVIVAVKTFVAVSDSVAVTEAFAVRMGVGVRIVGSSVEIGNGYALANWGERGRAIFAGTFVFVAAEAQPNNSNPKTNTRKVVNFIFKIRLSFLVHKRRDRVIINEIGIRTIH